MGIFRSHPIPVLTPDHPHKNHLWWRSAIISLAAIYVYLFMEWLFIVTKPSFMDLMAVGQKFEIPLVTGLFIVILWLPVFLLLFGLSKLPWFARWWKAFLYASGLISAGILAVTTLLAVDNFTYTLFNVGVVSTTGIWRGLYAVLFLIVLALWFRWVIRRLNAPVAAAAQFRPLLFQSVVGIGILGISLILAIPKLKSLQNISADGASGQAVRQPNILLIGSDGVNARNMSLYGYARDTTPNLSLLANESLVAENAFTNSGNTSGSIISIFNSKLPTQTRVVYPPDILRGTDAYQHLPGILRSLGYRNLEISAAHYIDAYTLNVRDGFDVVNERSLDQTGFQIFSQMPGFQDSGYFLSALFERISDRLLHIFFIRKMVNPYEEVTTNNYSTSDQNKVRKLLDYFRYGEQPMFIHVHLMGTHGAFFNVDHPVFSAGQTQDEPWMTDFYDDTIHAFDEFMGLIWSELTKMDMLDNTIIIVYSDHAQDYHTEQSVPLMIRFPHGEYARRVRSNVENLDIAPTVLDYLEIPIPDWMDGQSLLDADPDPFRPIFSTGVSGTEAVAEDGFWVTDETRIQPPFYQFAYLRAVVCQEWYLLDLRDYYFNQGEVLGHSAPCPQETLPDKETIVAGMIDRLALDGFDISPLQERYSPPTSD